MNKYEYCSRVISSFGVKGLLPGDPLENEWLNKMGNSGWELVSILQVKNFKTLYYFKRLLNE